MYLSYKRYFIFIAHGHTKEETTPTGFNTDTYKYTLTSFYFSTHYEDKIIPFRIPIYPLIFKSKYFV